MFGLVVIEGMNLSGHPWIINEIGGLYCLVYNFWIFNDVYTILCMYNTKSFVKKIQTF